MKILRETYQNITKFQIIRYAIVGCINTAIYYTFFALFVYLGFHYPIATLLGFGISIFSGFIMHSIFVFNNKQKARIIVFTLVNVAGYFFNVLIQMFLHMIDGNIYIDGAMAAVITAVFLYILNKYITFRKHEKN